MKNPGNPRVLAVNEKAKPAIQDTEAYQRLLDLVDRKEANEGIRQGLEDVENGRTRPAQEALEEIRRRHKIPTALRVC